MLIEEMSSLNNHVRMRCVDLLGMGDPWRYRNKMECTFGWHDGKTVIGFHKKGSFYKIVDIEECLLVPEILVEILKKAKGLVNQSCIKPYNPKTHQGFWRHLILRHSKHYDEVMVICVTNCGFKEAVQELCEKLFEAFPIKIKSFYWGISSKVADVATPQELYLLKGEPCLHERINSISLNIYPMNFIQPNLSQAKTIYEDIKSLVDEGLNRCAYDLYCGIGIIAMILAQRWDMVYGIDSDRQNIDSANENLLLMGRTNVKFLCGKVEDILCTSFHIKNNKPDAIILDPPRAGLHKALFTSLANIRPRKIIYLSCNPRSLIHDTLIILKNLNYNVTHFKAYDMFPHTGHLETLTLLERR